MTSREEVIQYFKDQLGWVPEFAELLADYAPESLKALLEFRKSFMRDPPEGALPRRFKEILYVVLDTVAGNVAGGKAHARAAIDAGATVREIAEALVMTMYLRGIPTMEVTGKELLKAAIERENELRKGGRGI